MIKEQRGKTGQPLSVLIFAGIVSVFFAIQAEVGIAALVDDPEQETETSTETSVTVETAEVEAEESYYDNPAQAAHAAQLAEKTTLDNEGVKEALSAYQAAQEALENATDEEKLAAEEALELAETAYKEKLAEKTGVVSAEIADMRASGMGWGEIAHELGVHPGALGLGHSKKDRNRPGTEMTAQVVTDTELAEATARNPKTGNAKGHGAGLQSGSHTPGTGLDGTAVASSSKTRGEKGPSGNVAGATGLSGGGKGNSSSSGSGQGSGSGSSSSGSGSGGSGSGSGGSGSGGKGGNSGNSGNSGGGNSGGGGNGGGGNGGGNGGGKK